MDRKLNGIIYKVTNLTNGMIYIGQTVSKLHRRRWSHESKARLGKSNMLLPRAIYKYGADNFKWEVLEECFSKDEMDEMEFHYIKQYNTLAPNGYNLTLGGEGCYGFRFDIEFKKTMNYFRKGTKLSKDCIEKRSLLQSHDWEVVTPDGKVLSVRNLNKFCMENGLNTASMYRVARGTRGSYLGFKCRSLTNNPNKKSSCKTKATIGSANKGRKLSQAQLDARVKSEWVIVFPDGECRTIINLKRFCKDNNLAYNCMLRVWRGDRAHHKGFKCRKIGKTLEV